MINGIKEKYQFRMALTAFSNSISSNEFDKNSTVVLLPFSHGLNIAQSKNAVK